MDGAADGGLRGHRKPHASGRRKGTEAGKSKATDRPCCEPTASGRSVAVASYPNIPDQAQLRSGGQSVTLGLRCVRSGGPRTRKSFSSDAYIRWSGEALPADGSNEPVLLAAVGPSIFEPHA